VSQIQLTGGGSVEELGVFGQRAGPAVFDETHGQRV
jgi:hypothetical protein